ncbi:hypothetical protein MKW98_005867 [Papaver atlanticum]|uniref:Uncharacterized protein n=1 Tax=Papaver atlanticum TaxID=357466 RepID=A0AAD4TDM8_9MAGN|nr:hypothetical protein MKW98_005867 [Papaver atlanticum]
MSVLKCNCLSEVDLTDCEALMNSTSEVFSDEGGCLVPKSLALDSCEVGIRSLNFASIHCPRLIKLDSSFYGQLKDDCLSAATTAACL